MQDELHWSMSPLKHCCPTHIKCSTDYTSSVVWGSFILYDRQNNYQ